MLNGLLGLFISPSVQGLVQSVLFILKALNPANHPVIVSLESYRKVGEKQRSDVWIRVIHGKLRLWLTSEM